MPQPIAKWNPARDVWETDQACLCGHSDVFSETFPGSGMTVAGTAYELPTSAPRTDGSECSLLPTPAAANAADGADLEAWEEARRALKEKGYNGNGRGTPLAVAVRLLPSSPPPP